MREQGNEVAAPGWGGARYGRADYDRRIAAGYAGRHCVVKVNSLQSFRYAAFVRVYNRTMPVFAYRGLAANGRSVAGVIDADSARTARGKLRELGVFPTELAEEESAAARPRSIRRWLPAIGRRIPAPELALLTRQLSALLGAGVQLVDALSALAGQVARPAAKRMLSQVREGVREGSSLADALAVHPDVFSDLYVGMVRAGEAAGAL